MEIQLTPQALYPWGKTPVLTDQEDAWAPKLVWIFWVREEPLDCVMDQTNFSVSQPML